MTGLGVAARVWRHGCGGTGVAQAWPRTLSLDTYAYIYFI
jgi:hypothetical protein